MPDPFNPSQQYASNAQQVTQLPMQYQQGIDAAMIKRQLAALLMQRGQQQPQGQTVVTGAGAPNRYVKSSPLENLSSVAQGLLGGYMMNGAQRDLMQTAQDYQNFSKAEAQRIFGGAQAQGQAPAMDNPAAGPGPAAPPTSQPAGSPSSVPANAQRIPGPLGQQIQQARGLIQLASQSSDPTYRNKLPEFQKMLQDLEIENVKQMEEDRRKALDVGAPHATAESAISAANAGGDPSLLRAPPKLLGPDGQPAPNGITDLNPNERAIQSPQTNAISISDTAEGRMNIARSESANRDIEEKQKFYRDTSPKMNALAQSARTADAMVQILPHALTGAMVNDREEAIRLMQLLPGVKISPGVTYLGILRSMAPQFLADIRSNDAGGAVRNFSELQYFAKMSQMDFSGNQGAIANNLTNFAARVRAEVNRYNRDVESDAQFAIENHRMDASKNFLLRKVDESWLAPVETGLPPAPQPGTPPVVPGQQQTQVPFRSHWAPHSQPQPNVPVFTSDGKLVPQP